jgi:hypothetical protein
MFSARAGGWDFDFSGPWTLLRERDEAAYLGSIMSDWRSY